jgi:tyrosyl-tRNA synthetase
VKLRLERDQELSFLEFNYMILQAYDFVELHRRHGCVLQMGGSDQWGNIVNGIDLGRRMGAGQLYAITCPLLTTSSGAKMGKTAQGAVWLNPALLSPYEYWQYWRNTEDADVGRFLRLFTELPLDEIARLERGDLEAAKKSLATEATKLLHGPQEAETVAETARAVFGEGGVGSALPTREIDRGSNEQWRVGRSNTAIVTASGLVRSNTEARQKIAERAVRINDRLVTDPYEIVRWDQLIPSVGAFKVQVGKKRVALVKPKD